MCEYSSDLAMCSIVVLAHNRVDQIRATLENLKTETFNTGVEIVVVDNASLDQTRLIIEDVMQNWFEARLIRCERNVGISEGRNIGWRLASRDYIISIDDDIIISRAMIGKIIAAATSIRNFGILSPTIRDSKTGLALNGTVDNGIAAASFYEACFLIPRSIIDQVGYMDKLLTMAGEGMDYSLRILRANLPIIRLYDVIVYHYDRPRVEGDNELRRLAWAWSFARVYWKNYSPTLAFMFTARNFISHLRSGYSLYGFGFAAALLKESFKGSVSGRRSRGLNVIGN